MRRRLKIDTDIKPVSDFRANAAELIEQVRKETLVLTQRGHSAAVVMDVVAYEAMLRRDRTAERCAYGDEADRVRPGRLQSRRESRTSETVRSLRIVWTSLAVERAHEAARYIARDKPEAALSWLEGLFESTDRLQHFPQSGRMVPEIGLPEYREIVYRRSHRVVYINRPC